MVEHIKKVDTQLHVHLFSKLRVLDDRKIEVAEGRTNKSVAWLVTEMLSAGTGFVYRVPCAWGGECAEIQEPGWSGCARKRIANDVRTLKKFVAPVKVFERMHREWLAAGEAQNTI